jgi:hypothetical protein
VISLNRRIVLSTLLAAAVASTAAGQASLFRPASLPRIAPGPGLPSTYGTAQESLRVVIAAQASPANSSVTYGDLGNGNSVASRYATGGLGAFIAPVDVPSGALLTRFELDACDSNAANSHVQGILAACDSLGQNCAAVSSTLETLSNVMDPCQAIVEDLTGLNFTVDNATGNLFAVIATNSLDDTNSFSALRIGYKLQVSPAPAAASFNDVPASHPLFQYIEAIHAAGITAGCGGGNYCPDNPLTRGQMAVFLAKALGLQWP